MVCQYCGQHEATVHIKRTVNGDTRESFACKECTYEQGFGSYSTSAFSMNNIFGELFSNTFSKESQRIERCPVCGSSFRDIVQSGRVGCAECYMVFFEQLQPTIRRIHGSAVHTGKIISHSSESASVGEKIARLRDELQLSIERQDYERCAQIRDQIKEMEGEGRA